MLLLSPIFTEYKALYGIALAIGGLAAVGEVALNLPAYSGVIIAIVFFISAAILFETR